MTQYIVGPPTASKLHVTASMWVPSVNPLLHGLPPIIPVMGKRFCKFDLFWLEGSLLIVCLKRSYQLLSVLTRIGQAPNTVCAK